MNPTTKVLATSLIGAGLALATLAGPVAAQDANHWANDASDCEIFRALSAVVPTECAQAGDVALGAGGTPAWDGMKTRGIKPRGIRIHGSDAPVAVAPARPVEVVAVKNPNPPAEKSINARIQFEFDSFRLTDDARTVLDRLAGILGNQVMSDQVVQIEGHADASGSDDYNLTLSQLRARAVRAYLIQEHGIDPSRLEFQGKGESELYNPNNPTAPENRRVVFTNLTG